VLDLHRAVDCAPSPTTAPPKSLVLELQVDGQPVVRTVDVGAGQPAYEGRLHDVLGRPRDACDLNAKSPLLGPIDDRIGRRDVSPAS